MQHNHKSNISKNFKFLQIYFNIKLSVTFSCDKVVVSVLIPDKIRECYCILIKYGIFLPTLVDDYVDLSDLYVVLSDLMLTFQISSVILLLKNKCYKKLSDKSK